MTPLVLLPGMMCDARLFGPQARALQGRIPTHVLPVDGADTMEGLARLALAAAPARFALAGLSMGGIVAMEMVRQAPDRVVKLALMDTNPLAEDETRKQLRGPQVDRVRAGGLSEVIRDEMKPNYLTAGPDQARILDLCMDMALALGPEVFVRQSLALRDRPDQSETLRGYGGRSLVLCGAEDALCPVARHRLMHDLLPDSRLVIIDGAAHLPTLEKPDQTTAALLHWLED
ncbi:MAG: alpha/beta fold hydrolase [Rhodobacteraceae bacterium]|nr:alpha/beta fold hydrolase [Paracoccaceae bacterium]